MSGSSATGGQSGGPGPLNDGQSDFSAEITNLKTLAEQPDIIMAAAYEPDFPAFLQQLSAAGVDIPVYGADAIGTPTVKGLGSLG